jgi:hypothetical protein
MYGTAEAVPFQNGRVFSRPVKPCPFENRHFFAACKAENQKPALDGQAEARPLHSSRKQAW